MTNTMTAPCEVSPLASGFRILVTNSHCATLFNPNQDPFAKSVMSSSKLR